MKLGIAKKLNSKKGSALLLALLFSIICLLLGVVILTAGVTSNGRIVNAARTEQGYFIVSSVFNEIDYLTRVTSRGNMNAPAAGLRFEFDIDKAGSEEKDERNVAIIELSGDDILQLGPLRPYITSALKDAILDGSNQLRLMEFTFGEELGEGQTYVATVEMTVKANDYSIYFDVTDIRKGMGRNSESVGIPNLHRIAVQARSVTPIAVERLEDGTDVADVWKMAAFEYHSAKFVN